MTSTARAYLLSFVAIACAVFANANLVVRFLVPSPSLTFAMISRSRRSTGILEFESLTQPPPSLGENRRSTRSMRGNPSPSPGSARP